MLLFFIHVGLIIFMISLSVKYAQKTYCEEAAFFSGAAAVILIVVMIISWGCSYGSYVDLRTYKDGEILQHDLKALNAVSQTINADDNLIAESKDGYYEGLVEGIYDAKRRINDYNRTIIEKKMYGNNIFFGWYVIEPDEDMKVIDVSEYDFNIGE